MLIIPVVTLLFFSTFPLPTVAAPEKSAPAAAKPAENSETTGMSFDSAVKAFAAARAQETAAPTKACAAYEVLKGGPLPALARLAEVRRSVVCPQQEIYEPKGDELSWLIDWIKESTAARLQSFESSSGPARSRDFNEGRLKALLLRAQLDDEQGARLEAVEEGLKIAAGAQLEEWSGRFAQQKIRVAPRFTPNATPAEFGAVIEDFFKARAYDDARAWLKKKMTAPELRPEEIYRLKLAFAQSYKREQKKKANLDALRELFGWAENLRTRNQIPAHLFHEALTLYTRGLWTNGDRKGGERVLKKYYPRFAKEEAAELAWIIARMEEEARDYNASNLWADRAAQQAAKDGPLREKALFLAAWNLKKMNALDDAITAFEKLAALPRRPHELAKYEFWLGWLHEKRKSKKAEDHFRRTAEADPFGYYGILSTIHRGRKFPALKLAPAPAESTPALDAMARTLAALGEKELLKKYLGHRIAAWDGGTLPEEKYAEARALADVGTHLPLFTLFNALETNERGEFFRAHAEAVFPRKYSALIEKAARDRGLPPELLFSIIRQESTYDPEARSVADAMGLMQVLATAAPELARRAGVKYAEHDDLFKPEVNIPLGSLLMSDVYKRMNGNFLLTAAGYNANPASVAKWISARNKQSFIEFIEEIPYEETRTYMKLVLRNFVFYRRLQSPEVEIATPPECLESLQFPKKSTPKRKKK